ncbi:uncharacterized protein LOC142349966 [Convolutriloba macropyga]|uniref:uncharacterized protein LOC142349966 n=1 Tax=Convolutriloba macropyga TaxID=536237 RepID=UPI003F523F64
MFRHLFFTNRILRARNASLRCTRVATHQKPQRVQFLNVPKPPSESSRLDGSADRCNQLTITALIVGHTTGIFTPFCITPQAYSHHSASRHRQIHTNVGTNFPVYSHHLLRPRNTSVNCIRLLMTDRHHHYGSRVSQKLVLTKEEDRSVIVRLLMDVLKKVTVIQKSRICTKKSKYIRQHTEKIIYEPIRK